MLASVNPKFVELMYGAAAVEAEPDQLSAILNSNEEYATAYREAIDTLLNNCVSTLAGPVYSIPMLTPESCDRIVESAKKYGYDVNEEEGVAYRIDEAVLQVKDPDLYDALGRTLLPVLNSWSLLVYQRPVTRVASFQVAKYTPGGTKMTGFHHDRDSDVTAVISLNPGDFTGGGTDVRVMAHRSHYISPLPKGHALFFNGKAIHHRGAEVMSGERYLLVCWLESEI